MNWSAAFDNPSSPTSEQSADLRDLNGRLANVPSKAKRVWISRRNIKVGITYNITACARTAFSGQEACDSVSIQRVGRTIPKIMFPTSRIVISSSIRVKFRGELGVGGSTSRIVINSFIRPRVKFRASPPGSCKRAPKVILHKGCTANGQKNMVVLTGWSV